MGNADTLILHRDSAKKTTDLIFWAEIFTARYPTVDMTYMKISARFDVQNQKRKLGWGGLKPTSALVTMPRMRCFFSISKVIVNILDPKMCCTE